MPMAASFKIDFGQRSKWLTDADQVGGHLRVNAEEFVRFLKSLDTENKDQLPIYIMYAPQIRLNMRHSSSLALVCAGGLGLNLSRTATGMYR